MSRPQIRHTPTEDLTNQLANLTMGSRAPSRASQVEESASSSGATTEAPPRSTFAPTGFKVAQPDLFYGDRKKLRQFLNQVDLNLLFYASSFQTEEQKTVYASTYLRGDAADWFEPYLRDFMSPGTNGWKAETTQIFTLYSNFKVIIGKIYGDVDEKREAELKIRALRQNSSVSHYASQFQQLKSRITWNDSALTAAFYAGLKEEIKDELSRVGKPNSLAAMITQSQTIDGRIYERRLEKAGKDNSAFRTNNKPNTSKPKQYPKNYYGPMPMDLDQAQRKKSYPNKGKFQKRGKLTQKERDDRIKNKLCLYCGKPGHVAKECRAKQQMNSAEPQGPQQKAKRSSPPEQALMMAEPMSEPNYYLDNGKAVITAVTDTALHLETRYWRQAVCLDPGCPQAATHYHFVYDIKTDMKHQPRIIKLTFCQNQGCPAKAMDEEGEEHMHQGADPERIDCRTITFALPMDEDEYVEEAHLMMANPHQPEILEETNDEERINDWEEIPWPHQETPENVSDIDNLIGEAVRANKRIVEVVRTSCAMRGVRTPHVDSTISKRYLHGEYPCVWPNTCMMRALPHYHLCHYDPYRPHLGMGQTEARSATRCKDDECDFREHKHLHHPLNE